MTEGNDKTRLQTLEATAINQKCKFARVELMDIDEKALKALVEENKIGRPQLRVMDSGLNLSLVFEIKGVGQGIFHRKRGGVRLMSPQTALRFVKETLGADEITVVLKNGRG